MLAQWRQPGARRPCCRHVRPRTKLVPDPVSRRLAHPGTRPRTRYKSIRSKFAVSASPRCHPAWLNVRTTRIHSGKRAWRPRRDSNPCYRRERAKRALCGGWERLARSGISPMFMRLWRTSALCRLAGVGRHLHWDMSPQRHRKARAEPARQPEWRLPCTTR